MARESIPGEILEAINEHATECLDIKGGSDDLNDFFMRGSQILERLSLVPVKMSQYTAVYTYQMRERIVVIKRIIYRPDTPTQEDVISTSLKHQNLVTTLATKITKYKYNKIIWIVMEHLPVSITKGDMNVFAREEGKKDRLKDERRIRNILKDVLHGLEYMHEKNIAHLDIKIANIMGCKINGEVRYKLIDFGYSLLIKKNTKSDGNEAVYFPNKSFGTFPYKPPEIVTQHIHGFKSDIYCVGFVAWILSLGYTPFYKNNEKNYRKFREFISRTQDDVFHNINTSKELKSFIEDCLNVNRFERPTVEDLLKHPFIAKN